MRKIPAVMATQHPDNAAAPYWETDGDGFVSAQEEVSEAVSAFRDLNVDEYMWDWEGKHVDEAVLERFLTEHHAYFSKHHIGKDKFLTFRIPNIWQEKGYSLARAMMAILTAADMAKDMNMYKRPLFEVILPMTQHAQQLIHIQTTFTELAKVKHKLFQDDTKGFDYVELIPLVEGVDDMFSIRALLTEYARLHRRAYKKDLPYIRPFLARSDPALLSGLIPAVVANKIALSEMYQWGAEQKIGIYPIIGTGSLPFRGSCSPEHMTEFISEYKGVRTVTVQSGFRYDYPLPKVKRAIRLLQEELPKHRPRYFSKRDVAILHTMMKRSTRHYRESITSLAPDLFKVTPYIPRRRERRLHIGLLGYSRTIGKKSFPRAITYTAAMYSLGVPPELIGTGRTLRSMSKGEGELLHEVYRYLQHDITRAGHYLNKANLEKLAHGHSGWQAIRKDIDFLEQYFGVTLGPHSIDHHQHYQSTTDIYRLMIQKKNISQAVLRAGKLRHSLG